MPLQCVFVSLSKPVIDLQKMPFFGKKKKSSFNMKLILILAICEQAKLSHLRIENPYADIEKPTHSKRITVCCGFWSIGIFGSFVFENEQVVAVTINSEFLFTKIEEEDIGNIWFQQDGTTCHTAETILDVLSSVF